MSDENDLKEAVDSFFTRSIEDLVYDLTGHDKLDNGRAIFSPKQSNAIYRLPRLANIYATNYTRKISNSSLTQERIFKAINQEIKRRLEELEND